MESMIETTALERIEESKNKERIEGEEEYEEDVVTFPILELLQT